MGVYFCVLCSLPLIYISICLPILLCVYLILLPNLFLYAKKLIKAIIKALSVLLYLCCYLPVNRFISPWVICFCVLLCLTFSYLFLIVFLHLLKILLNFNDQVKVWDHSRSEHGCREEASTVLARKLSVLWWSSAVTPFFAPRSSWLCVFDFSYMQWLRVL